MTVILVLNPTIRMNDPRAPSLQPQFALKRRGDCRLAGARQAANEPIVA